MNMMNATKQALIEAGLSLQFTARVVGAAEGNVDSSGVGQGAGSRARRRPTARG